MAESASLALLKKGKPADKSSVDAELDTKKTAAAETTAKKAEAPKGKVTTTKKSEAKADTAKAEETKAVEAQPDAAEATETVEVKNMGAKELDALVKEHEIEVPENWAKMKVQEKRDWLEAKFGDGEQAAAETPTTDEAANDGGTKAEASKEVATTTTKAATKPKPHTKAAAKALTGEVMGPDLIEDMANEIENLKENDAKAMVGVLSEKAEETFFKLGGVLSVIQANSWFEPYASFRDYVEKEHDINYRRAMYWVQIYNDLTAAKIPWAKVKAIKWTKLKEIAGILTPDNVDEWVEIATKQNTATLIETVKNLKNANAEGGANSAAQIEDGTSKTVMTKSFKVHEDQKANIEAAIEKAKEVSGTAVDTVALDYICLEFIGGKHVKAPTLVEQLKGVGITKALAALGEAFPDSDFNIALGDKTAAQAAAEETEAESKAA